MESYPTKRRLSRLRLRVPVQVKAHGSADVWQGETRDVSACGVYFYSVQQLTTGEQVECTLVLPEQLTHTPDPILVSCGGKVLRVERNALGEKTGFAVEFSTFEFAASGENAASAG